MAVAAATFPYLVRDLWWYQKRARISMISIAKVLRYKIRIWYHCQSYCFCTYHFGTSLIVNNECGDAGKKHRSSTMFENYILLVCGLQILRDLLDAKVSKFTYLIPYLHFSYIGMIFRKSFNVKFIHSGNSRNMN